jgi:uncharacterized membrane protein
MIGCIILTAGLAIVAAKVLSRRGLCAGGPFGWHHHPRSGWHGHHRDRTGGSWGGFGMGRRGTWVWAALARLDLSPAQEKVVRAELGGLKKKAAAAREEGRQSRADVARSIRGEEFEEGALASMFIRHDDRLHDLRGDLAGALGRIHGVLDEDQRKCLADLLERGPSRPFGGPFRGYQPIDTDQV